MTYDRALLPRADVAIRLGHSLSWFRANYRQLLAAGFPAPAIGKLRSARWDPLAIDLWLNGRLPGVTKISGDAAAQPQIADLELLAEEQELNRRTAALVNPRRGARFVRA